MVRLSGVRTFLLLVSAAAEGGVLSAFGYAIHPFPGIIFLTQTVTQTGTGAGRKQRRQQSGQQVILSQKGRKGRESPFFPPPAYLHTQEVTGSSPVVSTNKKPRSLNGFEVFCFVFRTHFSASKRIKTPKFEVKFKVKISV